MPLFPKQQGLAETGLTHQVQLRNNLDTKSTRLIYTLRTVQYL